MKISIFLKKYLLSFYYILQYLRKKRDISYRFYHRYRYFSFKIKTVKSIKDRNLDIVKRLCRSYNLRAENSSAQWADIFSEYHVILDKEIKSKNYKLLSRFISNPTTNELFHGFDDLTKSLNNLSS